MSKAARLFFSVSLVLVLILGILGTFIFQKFINSPASREDKLVVYEIKNGRGLSKISQDLENQGIIKNAQLFSLLARLRGDGSRLKVGEYALKPSMSPSKILSILISGKSLLRKFTIAEGLSIYEISSLYEKQGFGTASDFLKAVRDPRLIESLLKVPSSATSITVTDNTLSLSSGPIQPFTPIGPGEKILSLEGYLFPETYQLTKYTTAKELVTAMVQMFLKQYESIIQGQTLENWSRHKIVTLASIIEKETGASFEREKISAVFHNRLKKKMRLQTDPTIIYGKAEETGRIENNITRADLLRPSRYNTYVINGMPPGPISNPGRESLLAVFRPEKSNYIYFVSRNDGTQVFSENLVDHNRAVRQYQLDPRSRENKSWRDLKQNQNSDQKKSQL